MTKAAEAMLNIYQRIAKVMKEVSYIQKDAKPKSGLQYSFVSHDAVTAKIRPQLVEHGIVTVPRVIKAEADGNRTTAFMEVDFVNIDNPEDKVTVPVFGYGIDNQDKGPGKAMSYAVKYAYLKVFALETGDDPEQDSIEHEPAPTLLNAEEEELLDNQVQLIQSAANSDQLKAIFESAWKATKLYPPVAHKTLKEQYDKRKEELRLKGV